ncbi:hypothetical protein [Longibaculum muris]|uniref:hypothetical protein n=1 Tax=Longibaculum muris TaxID=1796628 RepID=UPI003AB369B1
MFKVEIAFDENKVIKEDKYDLDKMYKIVDDAFQHRNLIKVDKGTYISNNNEYDFGNMWAIIWQLTDLKWFMENAIKMVWSKTNNNSTYSEDILKYCNEKRIGALYV